ncbi:hypothetical protein C2845_PM03G23690 [Panicum miliaceum]|uniref:Uncharacterized protein n=1 Tax=Panicum miliaceum TaxID=4540 RepID=A0A3L6T3P2_PANMI|nr:hypothetical protein C2845_PM03G23690 [Panicum miliaceum]
MGGDNLNNDVQNIDQHDAQPENWPAWPQEPNAAPAPHVAHAAGFHVQGHDWDLNLNLNELQDDVMEVEVQVEEIEEFINPEDDNIQPEPEQQHSFTITEDFGSSSSADSVNQVLQPEQNVVLALPALNQPIPPVPDFNLNVGMVQLYNASIADPVFEAFNINSALKPSPQAVQLWSTYFSGSSPGLPALKVPTAWAEFFTAALLSPTHFDWAKKFLLSQAWTIIQNSALNGGSVTFTLPNSCPLPTGLICASAPSDMMQDQESPPIAKQQRPVLAENITTSGLRRSDRLKKLNKGFKGKACTDKQCLACSITPPTLTPSVIKNLGATFAKMTPEELSVDELNATDRTKKTVKRQAASKSSSSKNKEAGASSNPPILQMIKFLARNPRSDNMMWGVCSLLCQLIGYWYSG